MQQRAFWDAVSLHLSTLGPIGRIPFAPGTFGSLFAILVLSWGYVFLGPACKIVSVICLFLLGGFSASRAETILGFKDPQCIVLDEVVGQLMALLPLSRMAPLELSLAFVLFRIFDILKPWPVGASESWLPHGFGIMIDDLLAGAYAALCLMLLKLFI